MSLLAYPMRSGLADAANHQPHFWQSSPTRKFSPHIQGQPCMMPCGDSNLGLN